MWKEGHGFDEYMAYLDALDGREVHVTVHRPRPRTVANKASPMLGPSREDIERIAADVVDRKLDYRERRR